MQIKAKVPKQKERLWGGVGVLCLLLVILAPSYMMSDNDDLSSIKTDDKQPQQNELLDTNPLSTPFLRVADEAPEETRSKLESQQTISSSSATTTTPSTTVGHENNNPKDDITPRVTLVGLISMQRSSSTFLSHDILASQTCWVSLNEILQPQRRQCGDAWFVWPGTQLKRGNAKLLESNSGQQYADFIVETGWRRCQEKWHEMDQNKTMSPQQQDSNDFVSTKELCQNHCHITWKEFPHSLSLQKHQDIWSHLHEQHDFYMLILERDIAQRWRSFWYAQVTNDWNTKGDKLHKDALAAMEVPPVDRQFRQQHEAWYDMIRNYVARPHAPPSLSLSYSDVTKKSVQEMQSMIGDFMQTTTT